MAAPGINITALSDDKTNGKDTKIRLIKATGHSISENEVEKSFADAGAVWYLSVLADIGMYYGMHAAGY